MNRRILLIDADPTFRTQLTVGLSRYRFEVVHEPDADEAIALGATEPPALVIVGVDEPEKHGFKAFQRIKRGPLASTPIVLVTSTVAPESFAKHRGLKVHADDYLDKRTLTRDELIARIDQLIALGAPADEDLDIPVEVDDIPMDGPGLDEEVVDDDAAHDFAGGQRTMMGGPDQRVDAAVDADIEDAFGSLMGDDPAPSDEAAVIASVPPQRDTSQPHVIARATAPDAGADDGVGEFDDQPATRADLQATMHVLRTERPTAPPAPVAAEPTMLGAPAVEDAVEVVPEEMPIPDPIPEPRQEPAEAAPPADDAEADAEAVPGAVFDGKRRDDSFETESRVAERPAAPIDGDPAAPEATQYSAAAYESSPSIAIADDELQELEDDELQEIVDGDDSAVPEPVPHPRSAEDAAEAAAARETSAPPAPEPGATLAPEPSATPARQPSATRPPFIDAPTHTSLTPAAPDLGLDTIAADAQRDQSGVTDRRALRQIGELERQLAQLKTELERARASADAATRGGGREREFMNLREKMLAGESELKKARAELATRERELGEAHGRERALDEQRGALAAQLRELEQRHAAETDRAAQLARTDEARAAAIAGLERDVADHAQRLAEATRTREQLERELASERAVREASASDAERALREEREQLVARHQEELAAVRQELALQHAAALEQQRRELDTHHVGAIAAAIEATRTDVGAEAAGAVAQLERQHAEDLATLRSEHEVVLARKVVEHAGEVQRVREDAAAKQAAAAEKHQQAAAQLTAEVTRLQAELAAAHAAREQSAAELASHHAAELERQAAAHAEALATRERALETARKDEAVAYAAAVADLKNQLEAQAAQHAVALEERERALEAQAAQHASALEQRERALAAQAAQHAAALEQRERALETARKDDANAYAAKLADLEAQLAEQAAQHASALDALGAQHRDERARHQEQAERELGELRQLLGAAKRSIEETTAKAQAEREALVQAHERATAEHTAQHERAIAVANGEIVKVKAVADAEHARAIKEKDAELARVRTELQATHAAELQEAKTERDQLERGLSAARDTIKRSEGELAAAVQTIADRNAELRAAAAAIAERDTRIADLRREVEAIEHENASYQEQVLRAYQKIKADEAMVARAKKAMAIALTVLDDPGTPKPSEPT